MGNSISGDTQLDYKRGSLQLTTSEGKWGMSWVYMHVYSSPPTLADSDSRCVTHTVSTVTRRHRCFSLWCSTPWERLKLSLAQKRQRSGRVGGLRIHLKTKEKRVDLESILSVAIGLKRFKWRQASGRECNQTLPGGPVRWRDVMDQWCPLKRSLGSVSAGQIPTPTRFLTGDPEVQLSGRSVRRGHPGSWWPSPASCEEVKYGENILTGCILLSVFKSDTPCSSPLSRETEQTEMWPYRDSLLVFMFKATPLTDLAILIFIILSVNLTVDRSDDSHDRKKQKCFNMPR